MNNPATGQKLVCEVEQHLGRNRVRAVAMSSTDGIVRGTDILDTGKAISVPVGKAALGRILNVLGEPVDGWGPIAKDATYSPIHREAPAFDQPNPNTEMFETGIKVVDLLARQYRTGSGKTGLFGVRRRRQDRHHHGTDPQHRDETRRLLGVQAGVGRTQLRRRQRLVA